MPTATRFSRRQVLFATTGLGLSLLPRRCFADQRDDGAAASSLFWCVEKRLPPERVLEGVRIAVEEDASNDLGFSPKVRADLEEKAIAQGQVKPAMPYAVKWKQNRKLNIRFLGGNPAVHKNIQRHAEEWMKYANITLAFNNDTKAEVRIAFDTNDGSWSYLGTDNLTIPMNRPTMNFGWLTPDSTEETYSSVVLHEFGHLLGMIHEHQSPGGLIRWNRKKVIDDCWRQMGWSEATVEEQIFKRYERSTTNFTAIDRTSIMMYHFPDDWTLDHHGTPQNNKLSTADKAFASKHYPKRP